MSFRSVYDHEGTHLGYHGSPRVAELVFDGPGGLETTLRFNDVEVDGRTWTFYLRSGTGSGRRTVGSMEAAYLGEVSEAIERIADGQPIQAVMQQEVEADA